MSAPRVRVCFVCLGNICRSPTAEGVMRKLVEHHGIADRFEIDSAGTAAYHVGERPDERSRMAAGRRGISLESRARQFLASDFERFDFVLAMDRENLEILASLLPAGAMPRNLHLLRRFDALAPENAEVGDPYYGGEDGFEEVLDQCEAACLGLVEWVLDQGTHS